MKVRQHGLTLVELMIAMVLGLLVLAAVLQIFASVRQTYRFNEAMARNQENARFAVETLSRDVRIAGNMGCSSRLQREGVDGTGVLPPGRFRVALNSPDDYAWDFGNALQGYHWSGGTTWSPPLPGGLAPALPNGDVITLRGSIGVPIPITGHPGGSPPGSADIQTTAGNGLSQGDILIASDCSSSAAFQISNANPNTSGNVAHNTGVGAPGNRTNALGRDFVGGELMRVATRTYFLRANPAGRPALYRRFNANTPEQLVDGVEHLRFEYGVDTNGNRQADIFQNANAVADWGNVVSVRISLVMVSAAPNLTTEITDFTIAGETITPPDRRLRQVVTTTVAIRNRLP